MLITPQTSDLSKGWTRFTMAGYSPDIVQRYCVQDDHWQAIRLSMKGKPTQEKLQILDNWLATNTLANDGLTPDATIVQVGNYLGALRRGGQLDSSNLIRKYK